MQCMTKKKASIGSLGVCGVWILDAVRRAEVDARRGTNKSRPGDDRQPLRIQLGTGRIYQCFAIEEHGWTMFSDDRQPLRIQLGTGRIYQCFARTEHGRTVSSDDRLLLLLLRIPMNSDSVQQRAPMDDMDTGVAMPQRQHRESSPERHSQDPERSAPLPEASIAASCSRYTGW